MEMFHEDSQLVKTWARLVTEGIYAREQVPKLFNLQEAVYEALDNAEEGGARM